MQTVEHKTRNNILLVLFLGVLMGALDIAIVGPALPVIQKSFGADERSAAWIFTIYVLFNLISVPLMAKLSDAVGRRQIYVLDVSLFALGSLLVALSPSLTVLLVGRAIQGFGAGGVFPVASAVIGDTFPPEKRGGALGLIGAVFGIAFLFGPILAGIVLHLASWHGLFLINLPVAVIVIALSLRTLPATYPGPRGAFDWTGMVVLGVLLAALTYSINQLDTAHLARSLPTLNIWPLLILAPILIPVFILVEQRAVNPVVRLTLFDSRQVTLVSFIAAGAGLGEASIVFIPSFIIAAFGSRPEEASLMLLPAVLAMGFASPLAGRMLDRWGSKVVLLLGSAGVAAGMFVVGDFGTNIIFFYFAALLVGFGLGMLLGAPLRYVMLNEAPLSERASAQGILTLNTSIGQLVSGALVGAIAASLGGGVAGYETAFLAVGVVMLLMTVLTFRLKSRREELQTANHNHAAAQAPQAQWTSAKRWDSTF
jgi:EmrB/QacA subfamily drug resistance transporter